jgi:hypothetical protein
MEWLQVGFKDNVDVLTTTIPKLISDMPALEPLYNRMGRAIYDGIAATLPAAIPAIISGPGINGDGKR